MTGIAAACGGGAASAPDPPAPVAVTTAKAVGRDVPVYLTASGSILADETTAVAARVSGVVAETPVDIGTYLETGAVSSTTPSW
jgi:multidrug efflux pump subunit AcrA (membrane-fusion protein)